MKTCRETWEHMTAISHDAPVRNYAQMIDMSDYLVETKLFPKEVLDAYGASNLEKDLTDAQRSHFNPERGGGQGNYRAGMERKIQNVVDCLNQFPMSKRAIITVPNNPFADHSDDEAAKCMRELQFFIEDGKLNASVFFRAQAAQIFPKNIHFIGLLMDEVAMRLTTRPIRGNLHYFTSILASDRWS